jgi:hypothetical protein
MNQQTMDQICNRIAKKFYSRNKELCNAASFDVDDLKQEAKLYAWKVWEKHKVQLKDKKEDLAKLISQAALWRLKSLREFTLYAKARLELQNTSLKRREGYVFGKHPRLLWKRSPEGCEEPVRGRQTYFWLKKLKLYTPEMFMFDVKSICNDIEYRILYERFINGKRFREIGKEINMSKMGVNYIFFEAVDKMKKKFFIDFLLQK